jgi:hypothetical protein
VERYTNFWLTEIIAPTGLVLERSALTPEAFWQPFVLCVPLS